MAALEIVPWRGRGSGGVACIRRQDCGGPVSAATGDLTTDREGCACGASWSGGEGKRREEGRKVWDNLLARPCVLLSAESEAEVCSEEASNSFCRAWL